MPTKTDPRTVVRKFASSIDANEITKAGLYLSGECALSCSGGEHVGVEAILGGYRDARDHTLDAFDDHDHKSEIDDADETGWFFINAEEKILTKDKRRSKLRRNDRVHVDSNGQITRIERERIPREPDLIHGWLDSIGVNEHI